MLNLNFDPFPLLSTERLHLRQVQEEDVNEIFFLRSDERVLEFLGKEPESSKETALLFINKINGLERSNEAVTWAITFTGKKAIIGTICFWNITKEHSRAELGYALHPDFQGRGIMQEALTAVLNYGFDVMKLHSVEARTDPGNASSTRLLERNRFAREGFFREDYFYNGVFLNTAVYSLLRTELK